MGLNESLVPHVLSPVSLPTWWLSSLLPPDFLWASRRDPLTSLGYVSHTFLLFHAIWFHLLIVSHMTITLEPGLS